MSAPRILLLGGLDPSGGAGLTTDARVAQVLGLHPLPVATCLTVQNRRGFVSSHATPAPLLRDSVRAAIEDGPVHAVKFGLVSGADQLAALVELVGPLADVPIVVDPVLSATSGGLVKTEDLVAEYRRFALPAIQTPNLPELERLAPGGVGELLRSDRDFVFVKGGHAPAENETIVDRLHGRSGVLEIRHPRIDRGPIHGTGCALATALASRLAWGETVETACRGAVDDLVACIERTPHSADGLPVPLVISASRIRD